MGAPVLLGGLGGREVMLIAAIVLLLIVVTHLTGRRPVRSTEESPKPVEVARSRAYMDRLLGRTRRRFSAHAPDRRSSSRPPPAPAG